MEQNEINIFGQEAQIFYFSIQMFSGLKLLKRAIYFIKPTLYIKKSLNAKTKQNNTKTPQHHT